MQESINDQTSLLDRQDSMKIISNDTDIIRQRWILGIFFIVLVAVVWTFASILVQYIFEDLNFKGPFFLTYISTALFAVNLPIHCFLQRIGWIKPSSSPTKTADQATLREIIFISAKISPLWFLANFSYNCSLGYTSVTSSTVISTTSSLFTFLLSAVVLRERITWTKLGGVLLCILGNIFTVFNDAPDSTKNTLWGDVLALFAAFMYGVYTVSIRKSIPNEDQVSIPLFFGWLGVISTVVLFPVVIVVHFSNLESLDNLSWNIFFLLVIKGLFDNVLSDYLWARAMILTSPTVATVGLSLTIPFAIVSDKIFKSIQPSLFTYISATLVILGFMTINYGSAMFKWTTICKSSQSSRRNG